MALNPPVQADASRAGSDATVSISLSVRKAVREFKTWELLEEEMR